MNDLANRFREVRAATDALAAPLAVEDMVVQTMPDASPTKWHLAHTTWFFETFVLAAREGHRPFHPEYGFLFNSYYEGAGARWTRARRGALSRPTVSEVRAYRAHVDREMLALLARGPSPVDEIVELGLHHEQQHQELLLTDVKTVLADNPLHPAYRPRDRRDRGEGASPPVRPLRFVEHAGGLVEIGAGTEGFAFDNERPRHRAFVEPFAIGSRLVTNGEYRAFVEDGGYRRPELWLSDGWAVVQARGWQAPLYWERRDDDFAIATLAGLEPLDPDEPVCHVSGYEADAYARWAFARLPAEAEWEVVAEGAPVSGNFVERARFHPARCGDDAPVAQLFGDAWEWTSSPYVAYPGFRPLAGTLGEYNGKFMCNQLVLRGGSCVTPRDHVRATYRNFFPPDARWQFTGIRLARDLG